MSSNTSPNWIWGVGRRKTAVARVRIAEGTGIFMVNGKPVDDYFCVEKHRAQVRGPLEVANAGDAVDVYVNARGGGISGQAGAVVLGLARALLRRNPEIHGTLRDNQFLTRDSRMTERKKYGQKKARKAFQFSKR